MHFFLQDSRIHPLKLKSPYLRQCLRFVYFCVGECAWSDLLCLVLDASYIRNRPLTRYGPDYGFLDFGTLTLTAKRKRCLSVSLTRCEEWLFTARVSVCDSLKLIIHLSPIYDPFIRCFIPEDCVFYIVERTVRAFIFSSQQSSSP